MVLFWPQEHTGVPRIGTPRSSPWPSKDRKLVDRQPSSLTLWLGWLRYGLHGLWEVPSRAELRLFTTVTALIMLPLLAHFHSLSRFPTPWQGFPGFTSQIDSWHLNICFRVCFWEDPNQGSSPCSGTMTHTLLPYHVQPCASGMHRHPFELLLETHKNTCQWIGHLGQGLEARERASCTWKQASEDLSAHSVSFPHTGKSWAGRASWLGVGGGGEKLTAQGEDSPPYKENVWVVWGNDCYLPHWLEKGKVQNSEF